MAVPTGFLRELSRLSSLVQLDDDELGSRLVGLVGALRFAVPSYCGLEVALVDGDQPVILRAFLPTEDQVVATTSLRLPFPALGPKFHPDSRAIFYAATPGAFVDLAADLAYALRAPMALDGVARRIADGSDADGQPGPGQPDRREAILLDVDLPPTSVVSEIIGLESVSIVNQAVGMLIDRGHHPDEAYGILKRTAAAAGVETHVFAARLLRR